MRVREWAKPTLLPKTHSLRPTPLTTSKRVSKAEVGISVKKRVVDTRVHTDVKEIVTTLRTSRECDTEVTRLQAIGDALSLQRAKLELKTTRAAYFRAITKQKQKVQDQRRRRLGQMDSAGKSKMLHSMINKAKEGSEVKGGVASEATMNFEGRSAHAVGEGQIRKLLAAYTTYVSMDSTKYCAVCCCCLRSTVCEFRLFI